ncbi:MAG: AmmeMemoRadiSam system protein B [Candidatus Kryptoniota bacterium]
MREKLEENQRRTFLKEHDYVRAPAVAGLFYPSEKGELERTVRGFLNDAKEKHRQSLRNKPFGIISPHAGYPFSGFTAAHAYSLLSKEDFKSVIIISPSHREYFDGISVFSGKAYSTPLGEIEVDHDLREAFLEKTGDIAIESRAGHRTEHAVEVQLPFLQLTLEKFKLLPIVMGDQKPIYCKTLGMVIADMAKENNVLVVASSDLSHYYDYDTANAIDQRCIDGIIKSEPEIFMEDLESHRCEACGGGPIASCLLAAKALQHNTIDILHHCNSGDTSGDKSSVVGYLSAILS